MGKEEPQEQILISKEEYDTYAATKKQNFELSEKYDKQVNDTKMWKDKFMEQSNQLKMLQQEKEEREKTQEEDKKRFDDLLKEAQSVYDESSKLERGIIKFIKMLG